MELYVRQQIGLFTLAMQSLDLEWEAKWMPAIHSSGKMGRKVETKSTIPHGSLNKAVQFHLPTDPYLGLNWKQNFRWHLAPLRYSPCSPLVSSVSGSWKEV